MSCRDRDVQSLIRATDRNRCNFTVQMHHTHASARTHARAGTLNMDQDKSHAECEPKYPYCSECAAAVTHRRNRSARKYATLLAASGNASSLG